MNSRSGFTLIELTVVVAIMAVALVFVVSRFDNLIPSARIRAEASKMSANIEAAFSRAAASGKPVAIIYDLNDQLYALAEPGEGEKMNPDNMQRFAEHFLPSSIQIVNLVVGEDSERSGIHAIVASPNGRVKAHSIFLEDRAERKVTIEVAPLTGVTSILKGHVEPRAPLEE
ncbi:MAG: prepilin-type N-terminal cleavage/methylation domain-containing protein [Planctomycetota bacterium]|nr:prepilin-type N-terminal cleavage/methylation domain-containing protein [Planctomycetota bacterium]